MKIPWKEIDYSWKWWRICLFLFPFLFLIPLITNYIYIYMQIFQNGKCAFFSHFGLLCPGCGGTRATLFLLKGHFISSFLLHPLPIYSVCIYFYFFLKNLMYIFTMGKIKSTYFKNGYIYIALGLIIINFVIKNILLFYNIDVNHIITTLYI